MVREQQHTEIRARSMAKAGAEIDFGLTVEGMMDSLDDTLPDEIVLAQLQSRDVTNAAD